MNNATIDLHCDLLAHMEDMSPPNPFNRNGIGCSFPALAEGNVKLQVMAIYTATEKGSAALALKQSEIFADFLVKYPHDCVLIDTIEKLNGLADLKPLGMIAAIENASGFCEEDEPLEDGFKRLEKIMANTGRILYIGMTHHAENRFGGGNNSKVGLKKDGEALLQYMKGKKIALDFSHTSDALAHDILAYLDANNLDIPILASHSNYRSVFNHVRNLPDDLAKEIIDRKGLIGVNFLRAFVNNDDPNVLYEHMNHGLKLGGENTICFGADFFCTDGHPDRTREPFYYPEHGDASQYPSIAKAIAEQVSPNAVSAISYNNALAFMRRIWG